jgi:hypothetical protein
MFHLPSYAGLLAPCILPVWHYLRLRYDMANKFENERMPVKPSKKKENVHEDASNVRLYIDSEWSSIVH